MRLLYQQMLRLDHDMWARLLTLPDTAGNEVQMREGAGVDRAMIWPGMVSFDPIVRRISLQPLPLLFLP